ncbi:MFS transporter [Desulfosporosinus sp. PR]|uniref:MFS transporter n=1 Tax=Candidatus Desulfosporosinus nitrosoreducens TaxID=3401928 RepID=UPI0027FCA28A|nr:MFS transporter [Desulfosporosinus sp. PR]MDQ7096739.1 MFS transporter [Desulfosporosinus sp. PR]
MKISSNRKWYIAIFTVVIIIGLLFVWWMSSSDFESSYREITQQYYGVVAGQVVNEIEGSIKYGKKLDSFYDVGSIFGKLTNLLPAGVKEVITNSKGQVLYTSFDNSADKTTYLAAVQNPKVAEKIAAFPKSQKYLAIMQAPYDILILPIFDKDNVLAGSFMLIYPSAAISQALKPEQMENLQLSLWTMLVMLILLTAYFLRAPLENEAAGDPEGKNPGKPAFWSKHQRVIRLVPVLIIMLGIGVQSALMYNQYQTKSRSALFNGAQGILTYIENSISALHQKGVPYEKMYGLSDYLTTKVQDTPMLWNIRLYSTVADTEQALQRPNTWQISAPLAPEAKDQNMKVEIQISQAYMNEKMLNMLLEFLAVLSVAAVVIYEVMRLPDLIIFRRSKKFNTSSAEQYADISTGLRILNFLSFMGMYASMPFSAILMRHWNARILGLSTDVTAALPMTLELLTLMLFSMLFTRLFRRLSLRASLGISGVLVLVGNMLCVIAAGPIQLILYRMICGIGFAGIKNAVNAVISLGSDGEERTGHNIASMNAGLLGGIMSGGSIGAIIANSPGIAYAFLFTALCLLLFLGLIFYNIPWKLLQENEKLVKTKEKVSGKETWRALFNVRVLKYFLMVTVPLNIGLMFIVAFIPGYVQKMNLPVIMVSYGYLFNGLAGIYLGSTMAKLLSKRLGRTLSVALMLLLGGAGILIIGLSSSVGIILLSTALMGLFDGFGSPAAMNYFIEIPEIKDKVGVINSLAFLGVMGNVIQMISPLGYGWMMLASATSGINVPVILGAVYLIFAAAFIFPARKQRPKQDLAA